MLLNSIRIVLTLQLILLSCHQLFSQTNNWLYNLQLKTPAEFTGDIDRDGNTYIAGYFREDSLKVSTVNGDVYLNRIYWQNKELIFYKVDTAGNILWVNQTFAASGNRNNIKVATCPDGSIYVTGTGAYGWLAFTSQSGTDTLFPGPNSGSYVGDFIAKYDRNGNIVWLNDIKRGDIIDIAMKPNGSLVIVGKYESYLEYYSPNDTVQIFNPHGFFFLEIDSLGDPVQVQSMRTKTHLPRIETVTLDQSGNLILGIEARASDSLDFNLDSNATSYVQWINSNVSHEVLVSYDSTFGLNWFHDYPHYVSEINLVHLKADPLGNIAIIGGGIGNIELEPGNPLSDLNFSQNSAFIASLSPSGTFRWFRAYPNLREIGLELDAEGSMLISGNFTGTIDYDPGPAVQEITANTLGSITGANIDGIISKIDSSGNLVYIKPLSGPDIEKPYFVLAGPHNTVHCFGTFNIGLSTVANSPSPMWASGKANTLFHLNFSNTNLGSDQSAIASSYLNIYPVPFLNRFFLDLKQTSRYEITVLSMTGEVIYHKILQGRGLYEVAIDGPPGAYLLYAIAEDEVINQIVVKQ